MKLVTITAFTCLALSACGSSARPPTASTQLPTSAATSTTASTRDTVSQPCNATADAAKAAAAVHYANTASFPRTFTEMTGSTPPELEIPAGLVQTATTLTNPDDWKLTMAGDGTSPPTFTCTVIRPIPTVP